MEIADLVVQDAAQYVETVMRLLRDDSFWLEKTTEINDKFGKIAGTNNLKVAKEWAEFIVSVTS
jgi:hypothetical protein